MKKHWLGLESVEDLEFEAASQKNGTLDELLLTAARERWIVVEGNVKLSRVPDSLDSVVVSENGVMKEVKFQPAILKTEGEFKKGARILYDAKQNTLFYHRFWKYRFQQDILTSEKILALMTNAANLRSKE